ncbi:MAG: response regulator transcription factor [Planctomycetota bacterium]|jgi:DNA-binding response OmpR family regulator
MSGKRILVVDDDPDIADMVKEGLEAGGEFVVRAEASGESGLAAVGEFDPHLILLDVMMPGLDGGEVAARLQEDPYTSTIPIVFLTGVVKKEEVGSGPRTIGGFPYLAKPVGIAEITACIQDVLRRAGSADPDPGDDA